MGRLDGRYLDPGRHRLGHPDLNPDGWPALASATCPPTPPTSTPARGSPTSATKRAPAAIARSPRPTAAIRWAVRSRPSRRRRQARPSAPPPGCRSSPGGCGTRSSAATAGRIHKARRQGPDGSAFAEVEAEVRYALGSGTRGIAYLIEREGFLLQSPIAWFAQQGHWDISPGYGEFTTRPNFERRSRPTAWPATPTSSARWPGR